MKHLTPFKNAPVKKRSIGLTKNSHDQEHCVRLSGKAKEKEKNLDGNEKEKRRGPRLEGNSSLIYLN